MSLSKALKDIRNQAGISQEGLAKELDVSFTTVNRWENGKVEPSLKKIEAIKSFCQKKGIPFNVHDFTHVFHQSK